MGEVHRAWDRALERPVAVKFFHDTSPREAERLLLEGRLQARVEHPNVVRVLDAGELGGRPCLVLQLVEGLSLDLVTPELPVPERVELVRQAALGVHAAHLEGLIHRDVKPGNILVDQSPGAPRALVTDFGLARGDEPGLTRSGGAPGTLAFMSPEQLVGGPVGFPADVYGLGATLYAALSGRSPHLPAQGGASPGLPPADLYRRVLERFQRGEPVSARPRSWGERALEWRRRNQVFTRVMLAGVGALVLSLGWGLRSTLKADAEALEAGRLSALGEAMEAELRMEHLEPAHDLRPALARLRARVEALRPEAAEGGGAASYALGKGLQLVGDLEGARAAYERAWTKGFRSAAVAAGLGTVLGELYQRERGQARAALEPAAREARLAELRSELHEPALRYLARAETGGWRASQLRAAVALMEEDFEEARARAADVLAANPGRYEALVLQAESLLAEGRAVEMKGELERATALAARARGLLDEAARYGRSDPRVHVARATADFMMLNQRVKRGDSVGTVRAMLAKSLEDAKALNPDDATLLALEARSLIQPLGLASAPLEEDRRAAGRAVELFRRAVALEPGKASLLTELAFGLYTASSLAQEAGEGSLEAIAEGLDAAAKAAAQSPWDPFPLVARSWLHTVEAEVLAAKGQPSAPALRRAIEASEESVRRGTRDLGAVLRDVGEARIGLALEVWRSGADPRPEYDAALASLDQAVARGLDATATISVTAVGYAAASERLFAMGADGAPRLEHAIALMKAAIAKSQEVAQFELILSSLYCIRAEQLSVAGADPRQAASEARRLLGEVQRKRPGDVSVEEDAAALPVAEARWQRATGGDPTPLLTQAERALERFVHAHPDDASLGFEPLARCALERALFARDRGGAATPARKGVEWLARPLEKEPRSPELWALRARLLVAAGDVAGAKVSLERAWATNPLVRGGVDSRLAEAELAAGVARRAETEPGAQAAGR